MATTSLGMSTVMLIATSRYQARELIVASSLAPVRITVGYPRFRLGYELAGSYAGLAPHGLLGKGLNEADFTRLYRLRLDEIGPETIQDELCRLAGGRPGVVVLCFEDVIAGEGCHRRDFATWWEERTGNEVAELGTLA